MDRDELKQELNNYIMSRSLYIQHFSEYDVGSQMASQLNNTMTMLESNIKVMIGDVVNELVDKIYTDYMFEKDIGLRD